MLAQAGREGGQSGAITAEVERAGRSVRAHRGRMGRGRELELWKLLLYCVYTELCYVG